MHRRKKPPHPPRVRPPHCSSKEGGEYSTRSTSPLRVSSGNKLGVQSFKFFPPLSGEYANRGRIECEVQNWTSSWSRLCHSHWADVLVRLLLTLICGWMVIWRRFLDSTVRSAATTQWIPNRVHRNVISSSFWALERSGKGAIDVPASTRGGKVEKLEVTYPGRKS